MADADLTARVRTALLALEGVVIEDLRLPLPSDLRDIAKASAIVSGVVEDRIPALLNSARDRTWDEDGTLHEYEFRRFTIGFPDILLVERANPDNILFQMEAKSWYVLSSDPITARFITSSTVMADGTILALVAWLLDGVVGGSPKFLQIFTGDAKQIADRRDEKWEAMSPPGSHRVVQPVNVPGTPRNLVQTLVRAEMKDQAGTWKAESDNFGKIHRIAHPDIQAFQEATLGLQAAGKSLRRWHDFFKTPDD